MKKNKQIVENKLWQKLVYAACLGSVSALSSVLILKELPIVQSIESEIVNLYFRRRGTASTPKNIVLIRQKYREDILNVKLDIPYTELVRKITSQNTHGIIINPDHNLNNCLPQLQQESYFAKLLEIKEIRNKVLIATYPYSTTTSSEFVTINKCLPIDLVSLSPLEKPENIQGFFEFTSSANAKASLSNITDYVYTSEKELLLPLTCTKLSIDECKVNSSKKRFKSIVYLAFLKLTNNSKFSEDSFSNYPHWIKPDRVINSFGLPKNIFNTVYIDDYEYIDDIPENNFNGKTVIIDIPINDRHYILLNSPFGQLSAGEAQASLLATLMSDTFYYKFNNSSILIITIAIAITISILMSIRINFIQENSSIFTYLLLLVTLISLFYITFSGVVFLTNRFIFQVITPILTWYIVGTIMGISAWLGNQKEKIIRQQQLLLITETKKLDEREALLHKIQDYLALSFSKIHEKSLQYLRLAMDDIEIISFKDPKLFKRYPQLKGSVERLRVVGIEIREHFDKIPTLIDQVDDVLDTISPELETGLKNGVAQHIDRLIQNSELTLKIIQDIDEISDYLQREQVFRFFKETIRNVIKHVQPPYGEATTLSISLKHRYSCEYTLTVENDGYCPHNVLPIEGYGTKDMNAIAQKLPQGKWERVYLPCGHVRVTLSWLGSSGS